MSRLMERLRRSSLLGRVFATTRATLREMAERLGVRHVVNLAGFPARSHDPESRRAAGGALPCRSMGVSPAIAHISQPPSESGGLNRSPPVRSTTELEASSDFRIGWRC